MMLQKTAKVSAALLIVFLFMIQTFAAIDLSAEDTRATPSAGSVFWKGGYGLNGLMTTPMQMVEWNGTGGDCVLIGTTNAVQLFRVDDGKKVFEKTSSDSVLSVCLLSDLDGDGKKEVAYSTVGQTLPNVVVVNSKDASVRWSFTPTDKVYTSNLGWHDLETITWTIAPIRGTDGGTDLAIGSWKKVILLDGDKGSVIWTHKCDNDVWKVGPYSTGPSGPDNVLASSQDGSINLLDSKSGKAVWSKQLIKRDDYDKRLLDDFPVNITIRVRADRSVWDFLVMDDYDGDGKAEVAVSTEKGEVLMLGGKDGNTQWKQQVMDPPSKTTETGFASANFFNIRLELIQDQDGDGKADLLVYAFARPAGTEGDILDFLISGFGDQKGNATILFLSTMLGKVGDRTLFSFESTEGMDFSMIRNVAMITNPARLLVPISKSIRILDCATKNISTVYYEIETSNETDEKGPGSEDDQSSGDIFTQIGLVDPNGSKVVLGYGSSGLLMVEGGTGEVVWSYLAPTGMWYQDLGDADADGVSDTLVMYYSGEADSNGVRISNDLTDPISSMFLMSGGKGENIWEWSVPFGSENDFGLRDALIEADFDGDGVMDILTYRQPEMKNRIWSYDPMAVYDLVKDQQIRLISGMTGADIWNSSMLPLFVDPGLEPPALYMDNNIQRPTIAQLSIANDLTGDGTNDVLAMGQNGRIYLLNGTNGDIVWSNRYNPDPAHSGGGGGGWWPQGDYLASNVQPEGANATLAWKDSLDGAIGSGKDLYHLFSPGAHNVTCTATDEAGETDSDTVQITCALPSRPYLSIRTEDGRFVIAGQTQRFDAQLYAQGYISTTNYTWVSDRDGVLKADSTDAWLETDDLSVGVHNITVLAVSDAGNATNWVHLNVVAPKEPLIKLSISVSDDGGGNSFPSADGTVIGEGNTLNFTADIQTDGTWPSGSNDTWTSDIDGGLGTGRTIGASLSKGLHNITFATGLFGSVFKKMTSVLVYDTDAPRAHIDAPANPSKGTLVQFNGSMSTAGLFTNSGSIVNYTWDFGEDAPIPHVGNVAYGQSVTHVFGSTGTFLVTLTVTDDASLTGSISQTVYVMDNSIYTTFFFERVNGVTISDGSVLRSGSTVSLTAQTDAGTNPSIFTYSINWYSLRDGFLGTGGNLNATLSFGDQTIWAILEYNYVLSANSSHYFYLEQAGKLSCMIWTDLNLNSYITNTTNIQFQAQNLVWYGDTAQVSYSWKLDDSPVSNQQYFQTTAQPGAHVMYLDVSAQGESFKTSLPFYVSQQGQPYGYMLNLGYAVVNGTNVQQNSTWSIWTLSSYMPDLVLWDFGDGKTSNLQTDYHRYASPGDYIVNLTLQNLTSGAKPYNISRRVLVSPDGHPLARIQVLDDARFLIYHDAVRFNGSLSYDHDDDANNNSAIDMGEKSNVTYHWDFGDTHTSTEMSPTHYFSAYGRHAITLTVTDNTTRSTTQTVELYLHNYTVHYISGLTVRYNDGNSDIYITDPTFKPTEQSEVFFDVQMNTFGYPQSNYLVEWTSNRTGLLFTGQQSTIMLTPGLHSVTVSITDLNGESVQRTFALSVLDKDSPSAVFSVNGQSQASASVSQYSLVQFDAGSSKPSGDGSGSIATWAWDFGDPYANSQNPNLADNATPTHVYSKTGTYAVKLTVINGAALSDTTYKTVKVSEYSYDFTLTYNSNAGNRISSSTNISFNHQDQVGSINQVSGPLHYNWTDDVTGRFSENSNGFGSFPPGEHTVTLAVTSDYGFYASSSVSFYVCSPPGLTAYFDMSIEGGGWNTDKFLVGDTISFNAVNTEVNLTWVSNLTGVFGYGGGLRTSLSPGRHLITLEARDGAGGLMTFSRTVGVYGPADLMVKITNYNQFTWYQGSSGGDVSTGKQIYNNWLPQNNFQARYLGDGAGDSRLLAFDNSRITFGAFDEDGDLAVNGTWTYYPFQPGEPDTYLDTNTFKLTPDLDGDGLQEVMFVVLKGRQVQFPGGGSNYYRVPYVYILSSKTGSPLINLSAIFGSRVFDQVDVVSADDDLDGNDKADLLLFAREKTYDQKKQQEMNEYLLMAISSTTGALIWEHGLGTDDISMDPGPLTMVADKNADGSPDIVMFCGKGQDITIDTLSGRTGKIVSTGGFKFERNAPASFFESLFRDMGGDDYNAVSSVSTMGDITGDGVEDFALVLGIDDGQMEFVDGASLKSIKTIYTDNIGVLSTRDVDSDGHDDVLLYYNSQFFMLNGGFTLHITSPSSGNFDSGAISVRWDLTAPCEVLVDGISHGYFTGGHADLDLSGGEHQVTVRYRDEFGSVMKDSVKVNVAKSPWPTRINYIAAALGVLIIIGYIVFSIVRWSMIRSEAKKRALKSMASQEDHKKMEAQKGKKNGEAKEESADKNASKPEKKDKDLEQDAAPDKASKKAPKDTGEKKAPKGEKAPKDGGGSDE